MFSYSGTYLTFTVPFTGTYTIECWGAQGCFRNISGDPAYGRGSYVAGDIELNANDLLYIYIGQQGSTSSSGAWNGGGVYSGHARQGSGGGGTDVRRVKTPAINEWKEFTSLKSRIIVAAGGGACDDGSNWSNSNPHGGGVYGINVPWSGYGMVNASQIDGGYVYSGATYGKRGQFGCGNQASGGARAGGGGGYYGGGESDWGSMGGSSFISGHAGCVAVISSATESYGTNGISQIAHRTDTDAIDKSTHYSGKKFTNTKMIDGAGHPWTNTQGTSYEQMPSVVGVDVKYDEGMGHVGNGYCRISGTTAP